MTDLVYRYRYSLMWAAYVGYLIGVWHVIGASR